MQAFARGNIKAPENQLPNIAKIPLRRGFAVL